MLFIKMEVIKGRVGLIRGGVIFDISFEMFMKDGEDVSQELDI